MQKTIYLVRHAKSSWEHPGLADIDRPLNNRGKKNAPEMGSRLKNQQIFPDLLISSPAKRAYNTALAMAEEIGYSKEDIVIDDDLYHGGEQSLFDIIRGQNEEYQSIMLFFHNPGITWFSNQLCNFYIANIPTAGVVSIGISTPWNKVTAGSGELIFFDYPKKGW